MTSHNRRILIVDDNLAIHKDFQKILAPPRAADTSFEDLEAQMFETEAPARAAVFELAFASQGEEALALVTEAARNSQPFALARSSTCACRPAGMGSRRSSGSGR